MPDEGYIRFPVITHNGGESRTKQSFKEESDINKVLGKYRRSGFVEHVNLGTPIYEDFSNVGDFNQAQQAIARAESLFASLPARVRARVNNDPAQFIAYAEDPANAEELVELGLKNPISTEPVEATNNELMQAITNGGKPPEGEESDPA